MRAPSYFSFLICVHPSKVDLYYTGIPLGRIESGVFIPHTFPTPDGNRREVTVNDFPHPCPFKDIEEIKVAVQEYVKMIAFTKP